MLYARAPATFREGVCSKRQDVKSQSINTSQFSLIPMIFLHLRYCPMGHPDVWLCHSEASEPGIWGNGISCDHYPWCWNHMGCAILCMVQSIKPKTVLISAPCWWMASVYQTSSIGWSYHSPTGVSILHQDIWQDHLQLQILRTVQHK